MSDQADDTPRYSSPEPEDFTVTSGQDPLTAALIMGSQKTASLPTEPCEPAKPTGPIGQNDGNNNETSENGCPKVERFEFWDWQYQGAFNFSTMSEGRRIYNRDKYFFVYQSRLRKKD